jgi:hypothetical protein
LATIIPIEKAFTSAITTYDEAVLQSIVNSGDLQIACRLGFIPNLQYQDIQKVFFSSMQRLSDKNYIKEIITSKWKHRFAYLGKETPKPDIGLLKLYLLMQKQQPKPFSITSVDTYKKIGGFIPDMNGDPLELDDLDKQFMNDGEVFQYFLHKNNRFLMQLASFYVVVVQQHTDGHSTLESETSMMIDNIQDVTKKHVLILRLTEAPCAQQGMFDYKVPTVFYHLLPKIASECMVFSESGCLPLCKDANRSILVTRSRSPSRSPSHSPASAYSLNLTHVLNDLNDLNVMNVLNMSDPLNGVFYLPPSSHSIYPWTVKHYLTLKNPFYPSNKHPSNNTLIFVDFISKYCVRNQDMIFKKVTTKHQKSPNCIVLVDTRFNVMSLWSVLVSCSNAPGWQPIIYTSPKAVAQYQQVLKEMKLTDAVKIRACASLDCKLFHMEVYNAFLKDAQFWKKLIDDGYNKCLIVQDDGILVNGGDSLETYLEYDYVGAPWTDALDNKYIKDNINKNLVGNGGFSLRDVKKSYEVCKTFKDEKRKLFYHNINEIPEDVFFVKCLNVMGANIAPFEVARKFSVEQVFQHKPCGFHKFWVYHSPQDTLRMCDSWI